jgi:hypothetical protein
VCEPSARSYAPAGPRASARRDSVVEPKTQALIRRMWEYGSGTESMAACVPDV